MADQITIDRAVVQQTLEALEIFEVFGHWSFQSKHALTALRAALAQAEPVQAEPVQAEPVQEPMQESALQAVAEKIGDQCAVWFGIGARDVEAVLREAARYGLVRAAQAEPVREPVAWRVRRRSEKFWTVCPHEPLDALQDLRFEVEPLYTAPPQQAEPVREPFALPCPTPKACKAHCCSGYCVPPKSPAEPGQAVPCEHCSSPLFAAVRCRVCGRKEAK